MDQKNDKPSYNDQEPTTYTLDNLPHLIWEKISDYLDLKSKIQLLISSKKLNDHIINYFSDIKFEIPNQYIKFIQNKPVYSTTIKNIHLSEDVTDYIFPFPKNYKNPSSFRFFSQIKNHFPNIKNINLELKHFYMIPMLMQDPDFKTSFYLIKCITAKTFSLEKTPVLIETKYGQENLLSISDCYIYLCNSHLDRKMFKKLGEFTALEQLSLSPSGQAHCDYEDLDELLSQLTQLKILELDLQSDLTLDLTKLFSLKNAKNYHVMIDPPQNSEKYLDKTIRYPLKLYPNITTLTLRNVCVPISLLSHFTSLKHLRLDHSIFDILENQHLPSKILCLLEKLPYPEKLVSLQIPSSTPTFSSNDFVDLRITFLDQLSNLVNLEKINIDAPSLWRQDKILNTENSPFTILKNKNYLFFRVHQLKLSYNKYHTYHPGTFQIISNAFPNLKNLILIQKDREETVASKKNSNVEENKLITELQTALNKNLWKNIKIHLDNSFSKNIKLLFPNAKFSKNKVIISISSYKEKQSITKQVFSDVSDASVSRSNYLSHYIR